MMGTIHASDLGAAGVAIVEAELVKAQGEITKLRRALAYYQNSTVVTDWGMEEEADDGYVARIALGKEAPQVEQVRFDHLQMAVAQVVSNAYSHLAKTPDLRMLVEEVGELAEALAGKHEHSPELELTQIGGICLNWLAQIDADENELPA